MFKINLVIVLFLSLMLHCSSTANVKNWSPSQGRMNWEEANLKCKEMGMRLPTINELEFARRRGMNLNWGVGGDVYWSSTLEGKDHAQTLTIGAPIILVDPDIKSREHNFFCIAQ